MIELAKLVNVRADVERLQKTHEWSKALKSIAEQLDYLIGIERGDIKDLTMLKRITIGVLAARELEDMDLHVAQQLQEIDAKIQR